MGVLVKAVGTLQALQRRFKGKPRTTKYQPTLQHIYVFKQLFLFPKDVKKIRKTFEIIDECECRVMFPL